MIRLALILLIVLTGPGLADVVTVRSGDHSSFTRLVLAIPPGQNWRVGRHADGYQLDTGNADDTFDLTAAFDRIQRDRVAGLDTTSGPGRLSIALACTCHAVAFQWRPDRVVVDIIDGPAPPDSQFEMALDTPGQLNPSLVSQTNAPSLSGFAVPRHGNAMAAPAVGPAAAPGDPDPVPLVLPVLLPASAAAAQPPTLPGPVPAIPQGVAVPPENQPAQISETEQAIIESFARAASQGLLDLDVAPGQAQAPDPQQMPEAAERAAPLAQTPALQSAGNSQSAALSPLPADQGRSGLSRFAMADPDLNQPGISAQTSVDRALPASDNAVQTNLPDETCLDDRLLDMDGWGDDRDFSTQISEKLGALTTEFDLYPEGAVEALAKTYLFFGFGREAIQTLALDGTDSQQRRVMAAMGHLVDEEPEPGGMFASQLGCATQAALWTALSRGTLDGTTENERVAASAGFRTLPPMLRGHLGTRLAQLFVAFGDAETAASILEAARGQVTADRVETELTAADITFETEGADAAITALGTIAEEDLRLTPEALVKLINLTLDEGQMLNPGLISLADSMVYEHRGEPVAAALIAAQARALVAADGFDPAFALLAGDVTPMGAEQLAGLRAAAILALTARAADPAFLNFAFDDLPESGSAEAENAVAARLMQLGFADRAAAILISAATGAAARDRRYLQADIAVELGDFAAVDALLGGLSDPQAADIRARALTAQGDFAAASSAGQVLPGAIADPAEAWRAGEWSVLEQSDDPLLRAASDAVLAAPQPLDPAAPLAASRALLDQAVATGDLAGQLLDRFAVDPASPPPATN